LRAMARLEFAEAFLLVGGSNPVFALDCFACARNDG
jgi:hypothetical protein